MTIPMKTAAAHNSPQVGSVELPKTSALPVVNVDWKKHMLETPTYAELQQQLNELRDCLGWASENVEVCYAPNGEGLHWYAHVSGKSYHAPTLLSSLTTAYANREKSR